jgi:hypothetical protein
MHHVHVAVIQRGKKNNQNHKTMENHVILPEFKQKATNNTGMMFPNPIVPRNVTVEPHNVFSSNLKPKSLSTVAKHVGKRAAHTATLASIPENTSFNKQLITIKEKATTRFHEFNAKPFNIGLAVFIFVVLVLVVVQPPMAKTTSNDGLSVQKILLWASLMTALVFFIPFALKQTQP